MKKILFVVTQSEFGGAQRYIFEEARSLKEKYKILVAAGHGNGELFEKLKTIDVKFQNLKHLKRVPSPWEVILSIREIYNLLKKEEPNILFLGSTTAGLLGSIAAAIYRNRYTQTKLASQDTQKHAEYLRGSAYPEGQNQRVSAFTLKVIYRIGGWAFRDPRPFWQNKILFWAEKLTAPLKDKIIVNSEIDREEAIKYKICPSEKIVKIYNGIDVNSLSFLPKDEAREKLANITKQDLVTFQNFKIVGCVANFYKTKGLEYLIEAAGIINSNFQISNFKLVIIGDGKERGRLEAQIKKLELENKIILAGRIPDAYKYLKAFDIFVLPSLKEGFPWIILEAMATELPIIATKVGALPEIIENGKEGILVEQKNSQILAEKIFWLLNHLQEAKNMGIRAREKIIKEFPIEKMMRGTERLFT